MQKILTLLYPGCVLYEIGTALSFLSEYGSVWTASPDGKPVTVSEGLTIQVNSSYGAINLKNIKYALIPGGDCYDLMDNQEIDKLLQTLFNHKVIIGGICNGALILAKAGLLKGRHCTHTAHPKWADPNEFKDLLNMAEILFANAIYTDKNVVVDGSIVTAKPWSHIEFALTLAQLGGVITQEKKETHLSYYQGHTPVSPSLLS